ncbi:nitronate monooxygenase, partial [Micrococcus sp. SIMBA_144]
TASGLDPQDLNVEEKSSTNFGSTRVKAWKDVWGAGQGVGTIDSIDPVATIAKRMQQEYDAARQRLAGDNR